MILLSLEDDMENIIIKIGKQLDYEKNNQR